MLLQTIHAHSALAVTTEMSRQNTTSSEALRPNRIAPPSGSVRDLAYRFPEHTQRKPTAVPARHAAVRVAHERALYILGDTGCAQPILESVTEAVNDVARIIEADAVEPPGELL